MLKFAKWLPIILLVCTIVAGIIGLNFFGIDSETVIIAILVIISVDLIIIILGYLGQIAKTTSQLSDFIKETPKISSVNSAYMKEVLQANNSVFFSGVGMSFFSHFQVSNHLANLNPNVTLSFAVVDYKHSHIKSAVMDFFGISYDWDALRHSFDAGISIIKSKRPVNVAYLDVFVHISYFAVDYEKITENSFIEAKHYLLDEHKKEINVFYCKVRPGMELYRYYYEQIMLLKKSNGQLTNQP